MKNWKTNILGVIITVIALIQVFGIYTVTPEQSDAIQKFALAILAFFAADGSAVIENIADKFKNLGK